MYHKLLQLAWPFQIMNKRSRRILPLFILGVLHQRQLDFIKPTLQNWCSVVMTCCQIRLAEKSSKRNIQLIRNPNLPFLDRYMNEGLGVNIMGILPSSIHQHP
jgi:hypothetical protein